MRILSLHFNSHTKLDTWQDQEALERMVSGSKAIVTTEYSEPTGRLYGFNPKRDPDPDRDPDMSDCTTHLSMCTI